MGKSSLKFILVNLRDQLAKSLRCLRLDGEPPSAVQIYCAGAYGSGLKYQLHESDLLEIETALDEVAVYREYFAAKDAFEARDDDPLTASRFGFARCAVKKMRVRGDELKAVAHADQA